MKILFKHAHLIVDDNKEYIDGALAIDGEKIIEVFHDSNHIHDSFDSFNIIDLKGNIIMPGFFDTHIHGLLNYTFDNCEQNEFDKVSYELSIKGTTSFYASLSYRISINDFIERLKKINLFQSKFSRFEGIHLEGPFLNKNFVDDNRYLLLPNIDIAKQLISSSNLLRHITIACELTDSQNVINLFKDNNIKIMCGHSGALRNDLNKNVDGITHLFSYMLPFDNYKETLINSAFLNKYYVEVVACPEIINQDVVKLVLNNIDKNKIILVSNSNGSNNYSFSINDEIKYLKKVGFKYTDLLSYSSLNAFRFYGLDKKYGSIVKGKYSDIVIMDSDLNIINVLLKGNLLL